MMTFRAKIPVYLLQLTTLALIPLTASAQSSTEMKKIFEEAESRHLFEEYELAVPLYLLLEKPDNSNILYKIGTGYLNIPGEKEKAVPYLETAVKNSAYDAKVNSVKEKRAPLDSWFYLAKSYMISNQLEKALSTFLTFKRLAAETENKGGMENLPFIDQEIKAVEIAMNNRETPFSISKRLVEKKFSQGSLNENPAVSFDGNSIVYTERRGLNNAIMFSKKIDGRWQPPTEINDQLNSGQDCSSCSLNSDGTILFLYKTDNFDGNIYSSEFKDNSWTPIRKLNKNINTRFYESHAAISPDGSKLYFTSNRTGGTGGLDIYVSELDESGEWGTPSNLGDPVNTRYNEDTPFITLNDSILYFSSEGHDGMGGYDIFRSRGSGLIWSAPENMGFPINSTDDDRFFQPFNNDENGFYSITTDYKKKEIFYITLTNPRLNRIFALQGNYSLKDTVAAFDESNAIYLIDKSTGDTLDTGYPDSRTGNYSFISGPGNFRLLYTGPGYNPQITDTLVTMGNPSRIIDLKDIILDVQPFAVDSVYYEKLDLNNIPRVAEAESGMVVRNVELLDVGEGDVTDSTILYYTVQVMALYTPVDVSYFRYVNDIKVFYNPNDQFYRYTTGIFASKDDAYSHRTGLIGKGYPDDLFIKKVTRISQDKPVPGRKYYTIQLKVLSVPADINLTFAGLRGVKETKEMDGRYHYLFGRYTSPAEVDAALERVKRLGFDDAFVREISIVLE